MKGKQWEDREEFIPKCYTVPRHSFFYEDVIISSANSYH